jgi:hypothetical protein
MANGTYDAGRRARESREALPDGRRFLVELACDPRIALAVGMRDSGIVADQEEGFAIARAALERLQELHDQLGLPALSLLDDSNMSAEMSRARFHSILRDPKSGVRDSISANANTFFELLERSVYVHIPRHRTGKKKGKPKVEAVRVHLPGLAEFLGRSSLPSAITTALRKAQPRYTEKSNRKKPTPPRRRAGQ